MCYRARTPKIFQVRANMMIKKKSVKKKFVATTKSNNPNFFTFVVFCCYLLQQQKNVAKMLPTIKEKILFRKFFSKSISNVSSDIGYKGGGVFCATYLCICIIYTKIFFYAHTGSTFLCTQRKIVRF